MLTKTRMVAVLIVMVVVAASFALQPLPVSVGQTAPEVSSESEATQAVSYVEIEGRQVAIWKPAGPAPVEGYPVIVFSHGFTLCETHSMFMTEDWARAGYFVLAPHHQDGACGSKHRGS